MDEAWGNVWDLVFTTEAGVPAHFTVVLKRFQRICKNAGLPGTTRLHDLRHTFATVLIERGVHIKTVSELLGHSSVEITLRIYGHVTPRMHQGAIEQVNDLIPLSDGSVLH